MMKYLVEFIVSLRPDAKAATTSNLPILPTASVEMIKSMSLLHSLLHPRYWGDLDIDLSSIEILLVGEPTNNEWVNSMVNALQVVRIIVDVKHDMKNMSLLKTLLERSRKSDNSKIYSAYKWYMSSFIDSEDVSSEMKM
jgi:Tra1 HEAT repeat ring region